MMEKSNIKGFFKALKLKEVFKGGERKIKSNSSVDKEDRIQIVVTVQHFKYLWDKFDSRHICNNPENTIILDDEDIAYFKNKYKDSLQKELDEEIDNLKKQYEV